MIFPPLCSENIYIIDIIKKLDPKKINISVSEGVVKMDTATQNQYYDSYAKVQVLTTSHRCKVRTHRPRSWNSGLKFIFFRFAIISPIPRRKCRST